MAHLILPGQFDAFTPKLQATIDALAGELASSAQLALTKSRDRDVASPLATGQFDAEARQALDRAKPLREHLATRRDPPAKADMWQYLAKRRDLPVRADLRRPPMKLEGNPRPPGNPSGGGDPGAGTSLDPLVLGVRDRMFATFPWIPRREAPMPAGTEPVATADRMEIRIRSLECLDETNPEGGNDDMRLSGLIVGPTGDLQRVGQLRLGEFDDPEESDDAPARRDYDPPLPFGAVALAPGIGWPHIYTIVFVLAEHDNGGLDGFMLDLFNAAKDKIKAGVHAAVADAFKQASATSGIKDGGVGGAAIGSIWGPVGSLVGTIVGAIIGAAWDAIVSWWSDDTFVPSTQIVMIERPDLRFDGRLYSSSQRILLYDDADPSDAGGTYALTYDVVLAPDEDVAERFAAPVAIAPAASHLEILVRGTDHGLLRKEWTGAAWQPSKLGWSPLGGVISGRAAVVSHAGTLEVFALGSDNAIWHKQVTGSAATSSTLGWVPRGDTLSSGPAAVTSGDELHVFARAADGTLHWRVRRGDAWDPWRGLGGEVVGTPRAITSAPGRVDVFVRGTDNDVHVKSRRGETWGDWSQLGGRIRGLPAVVSWGPDRRDVVVRGTDDAVYQTSQDGDGAWHPWWPLGGVIVGSPTVASWGPQRLDVFVRGTDGQIFHKAWAPDTSWAPPNWDPIGGQIIGSPVAVSWASGRLDVFARSVDDCLVHKAWQADWRPPGVAWETLGGVIA